MTRLDNFTDAELAALTTLYKVAKSMLDTGGGSTAGKLLLGLYNGTRFPFDLTDLRRLDAGNLDAALIVIRMDAFRCRAEVHVILDSWFGDSFSTGQEFEQWAHNLRLKGKCKKEYLTPHRVRP